MRILNLKYAVFLRNEMEPLVQIQLCDKKYTLKLL